MDFWYGSHHALEKIEMDIQANAITAFIGPSGCGKSTFLRTLNRMNDTIPATRVEGSVLYKGLDIYSAYDVLDLRAQVGMVFQNRIPSR